MSDAILHLSDHLPVPTPVPLIDLVEQHQLLRAGCDGGRRADL